MILELQDELTKKVDVGIYNMGLSKKLDKEDYLQGMKNLALDEEKFKKAIALGDDI